MEGTEGKGVWYALCQIALPARQDEYEKGYVCKEGRQQFELGLPSLLFDFRVFDYFRSSSIKRVPLYPLYTSIAPRFQPNSALHQLWVSILRS